MSDRAVRPSASVTYGNPAGYERFMGRWSARLAPSFVRFAGVDDGQHVLDVGCGTGSLSCALLERGPRVRVVGVDPVSSYVAYAQDRLPGDRARVQVGAAESLAFADAAFDAALGLLVIQDLADLAGAVREMARVTRRDGIVAACRWDFADGFPMLALFWEAAEAVAPQRVAGHRASRAGGPGEHAALGELARLWSACGLAKVRTATLELSLSFASFDDYWLPFLDGATPSSAVAVAIERETSGALSRTLRGRIAGIRPDGSFDLSARALAVAGRCLA